MKKCVDKNDNRRCHDGLKYDSTKNECVKGNSPQQCPPGQEYKKNIGCVPKCRSNEKYNTYTKKCEPKTMNCQNGYRYDSSKKKCVPNKPTTPPQTCRYQYNQKTKTCKVISRGCTLEGFYSSTYKKCIPRCRNGQRYDNRSESCK